MSVAERILEEREYLENVANQLLQETGYLVTCEVHEDTLMLEDEAALQAAYMLANARVTSRQITLNYGFTRRDLTDTIKDVADNAGEECYSCRKIAEE